jgi:hypothetical protein
MAYTMATKMLRREEWYLEDPTKRLNLVQCNADFCGVSETLLTFYLLRSFGLVSSNTASFACS